MSSKSMNATGMLTYNVAPDAVYPVQNILEVPIQLPLIAKDTYRVINDRLAPFSNKGQGYSLRDLHPTDQE